MRRAPAGKRPQAVLVGMDVFKLVGGVGVPSSNYGYRSFGPCDPVSASKYTGDTKGSTRPAVPAAREELLHTV